MREIKAMCWTLIFSRTNKKPVEKIAVQPVRLYSLYKHSLRTLNSTSK